MKNYEKGTMSMESIEKMLGELSEELGCTPIDIDSISLQRDKEFSPEESYLYDILSQFLAVSRFLTNNGKEVTKLRLINEAVSIYNKKNHTSYSQYELTHNKDYYSKLKDAFNLIVNKYAELGLDFNASYS